VNLTQLERADELIRLSKFLGTPLEETFLRAASDRSFYRVVRQLLDDGQFTTLLYLKRAESFLLLASESITPDTEYLHDELEEQLLHLRVLLEKMEKEEHLRRDREALLSLSPEEGQGIGEWTSGPTPPTSR
jgi:hypothetical protein